MCFTKEQIYALERYEAQIEAQREADEEKRRGIWYFCYADDLL